MTDPRREWERWRLARAESLAEPHGWRSLTGLYWADAEPAPFGDLPGVWWRDERGLWVRPTSEGPQLEPLGAEPESTGIAPAADGPALVLPLGGRPTHRVTDGERLLEVLERGRLLGVRVRDPRVVPPLELVPAFDFDGAWVLEGRFEPYPEPVRTEVGSVADGVEQNVDLVGEVVAPITLDGAAAELRVAVGADGSFAFRDGTSGRETYPALRFARAEVEGDRAVVDFNRAVNPPCAFSDFGTCPLPPQQNVWPVRIEAGERVPVR
ncbi:DUF1684 domain-containing protein [Salana multivorans]